MAGDSPKILLVEDSADEALLLTRLLERHCAGRVHAVANPQDAFTALQSEAFDVITLDYELPGMDGLSALEQLRERGYEQPVVVVTGRGDEHTAARAMHLGAVAYVIKDENVPVLLPAAIEKAVALVEHRRLARELEQSNLELQAIYDGLLDGLLVADLQSLQLLRANPAACGMLGYSETELLGMNVSDLHPGEALPGVRGRFARVTEGEENFSPEVPFLRKDGTLIYVDITSKPILLNGRSAALGVFRDCTERKRTRERLEALNDCFLSLGIEPLRNVASIVAGGGLILDAAAVKYVRVEGKRKPVTWVSPELDDPRAPAAGTEGDIITVPAGISSNMPEFFDDLEAEGLGSFDLDVQRLGLRSMISYPVHCDQRFAGHLLLYGDATHVLSPETLQLAGMLARAICIEEERWEHEEELRKFIAIASHELRHPITVIKGFAITLDAHGDELDDEMRTELLHDIDRGADRLTKLVTELLDTANIEQGRFELQRQDASLAALVERALDRFIQGGTADRFVVRETGDSEVCLVDAVKVVQALTYVIENAVNYSPPGSDIEIELGKREGRAMVSVLDRGEGVPEPDREKIFERFYRVGDIEHYSMPGIGLGLYIARNIAEAHGGRIWYEPREGGGSIFRMTLD